jgi:hypothetical protein
MGGGGGEWGSECGKREEKSVEVNTDGGRDEGKFCRLFHGYSAIRITRVVPLHMLHRRGVT